MGEMNIIVNVDASGSSVEGDEHPKNVAMGGEGPDGLGGRPASKN